MNQSLLLAVIDKGLRWIPGLFLACILLVFGSMSARFITFDNFLAIFVQASWLIVAALGSNLVLLTAGVDLSVGAVMYLTAVSLAIVLPGEPIWIWPLAALIVGSMPGALSGLLIIRFKLPPFIATLALAFIARGVALCLSDTQMVAAPVMISDLARKSIAGIPVLAVLAIIVAGFEWILLQSTAFGPFAKALGADREGARKAGLPVTLISLIAYILGGALAGLAGFISLSQTSAATAAFGLNAEFLAIASAVLGGTSLFGGRGTVWAPIAGSILIVTVQNGLVLVDANPYLYSVVTGVVIFLAALFDSLRANLIGRIERRKIFKDPRLTTGITAADLSLGRTS